MDKNVIVLLEELEELLERKGSLDQEVRFIIMSIKSKIGSEATMTKNVKEAIGRLLEEL